MGAGGWWLLEGDWRDVLSGFGLTCLVSYQQGEQQQGGGEEAATADAGAQERAEARLRLREKAMMVIARMLDVDSTLVPAGERCVSCAYDVCVW